MANYVFYESRDRRQELGRTKYRSYSKNGFETADDMFKRLVDRYPRLICIEENYGEKEIMRGPAADHEGRDAKPSPAPASRPTIDREFNTPGQQRVQATASTPLDLAQSLISCVRQMGIDASRDGMLFGLRGTPELLGHSGHQWESWITKDIARRCNTSGAVPLPMDAVERFQSRHGGTRGRDRQFCDLFWPNNGVNLWIECKAIFEAVIPLSPRGYSHSGKTYLRDYTGATATADPKKTWIDVSIAEVLIDAAKLECVQSQGRDQLGLLVLELDRKGREIANRADYVGMDASLVSRGWQRIARETWIDPVSIRGEFGFQEHVSFYSRPSN